MYLRTIVTNPLDVTSYETKDIQGEMLLSSITRSAVSLQLHHILLNSLICRYKQDDGECGQHDEGTVGGVSNSSQCGTRHQLGDIHSVDKDNKTSLRGCWQ
jgi:hypothetical protein